MTADLRTALSRLLRAAKNANTWSNRIDGCDAVPQRVLAAAAQALEAANRAPTSTIPSWLQSEIMAAATASGDSGTIALAAQLAGCAPCPTCDYVKSNCRCLRPSTAVGVPSPSVRITVDGTPPLTLLTDLVNALNATNWSSWQTTHRFDPALRAANEYLDGLPQ